MIIVSKKAQKYFRNLLSKEEIGTQIRVFITNPGTPHAECGIAYCAKDEIEKSDVQLKYEQFFIYINENILVFLKDAKIDLVKDNLNSQLTVQAPYAKHGFLSKNCSLLEDKIKYFLSVEINPKLLMHGGKVNLIEIDENGIAKIQFSGGCNGCSMISFTLKETIEKKLLASFPEIKEVRDETNHLHGRHSFY